MATCFGGSCLSRHDRIKMAECTVLLHRGTQGGKREIVSVTIGETKEGCERRIRREILKTGQEAECSLSILLSAL